MRDVTVVIPCFNYGRYLPEAVASASAQDAHVLGAPRGELRWPLS